ncbi:hypothetical protein OF83DRAFT_423963 [Amylostereum chailletii]|nr:hypothetical protein OF83DRAFT_423963 [Amylostereum chailletii]
MARAYCVRGNPCLEYELDENGNFIGDPRDSFKLTDRAIALRSEKFKKCAEKRPPMAQLPVDLRPRRPDDGTPLLHYGFVFKFEQLMACAERHNIVADGTPKELVPVRALWGVMGFLYREARAVVFPQIPLSTEYNHMVSLYSNYSVENDEFDEEDEREIVAIVKKELQIPEDVPIMWWWDISNGPGCVAYPLSFSLLS